MYVPISMREVIVPRWKGLDNRRSYWAYLFARLKPGITLEQARADASTRNIARSSPRSMCRLQQGMRPSMLEAVPATCRCSSSPALEARAAHPDQARQPLTLLFGVTAIVLLICCANVANLLLGRAASRSTEMAVRLSIGAGRRHIVGQLLLESMLLGVMGGIGGLLVARWTLSGHGGDHCRTARLTAERRSSTATCSSLPRHCRSATGLLFGLFPAIHSTRPNLVSALKANAGQPSGAKAAARFRVTLATAQIALSMALLVSAGLFTKSLLNISRVDLGLDTEKLVVFGVAPAMNGHAVSAHAADAGGDRG